MYATSVLLYFFISMTYFCCWEFNWLTRYRIQKRATMPTYAMIEVGMMTI